MKRTRLRTAATLICGGTALVLTLAGCNDQGTTGSAPAGGASPAPAGSAGSAGQSSAGTGSTDSTGSGGTGSGGSAAGQGGTTRCLASELGAALQTQESHSEETGLATLILTNSSSRTCLIPAGWAPLGNGGPNYRVLAATRENYPGKGVNIALRPGRAVFAGVKYRTGPDCGPPAGLGVSWNGGWIPAGYVAGPTGTPVICDNLTIGTIQPSMNGVNYSN